MSALSVMSDPGSVYSPVLSCSAAFARCVCMCVCVGVCVCLCQNEKRVPDEWQARQAKIASAMEKSTEQEEAHFVSWVTVTLTREKERDYLLNLHMSQSTCFVTWIETGADFYGWQWCVCVTMKKVPGEWQARQAIPAILQVSSSKHNAKNITTRVRGPFHQLITSIITEKKKRREAVYKPTYVAVYLFRDRDRDRSRL